MIKSHLDMAVDLIPQMVDNVKSFLKTEYKNVQPFQSVRVSDDELVARYVSYPVEVREQLKQQNPMAYQKYEEKIASIIQKESKYA